MWAPPGDISSQTLLASACTGKAAPGTQGQSEEDDRHELLELEHLDRSWGGARTPFKGPKGSWAEYSQYLL